MLSKLYRFGKICYVGGGFNKTGIHNILEAAVYGKVVFFGPIYGLSREAIALIQQKAAYSVNSYQEFIEKTDLVICHDDFLAKKNEAARNISG